ncbi:MAG: hypothetical protein V3V97_12615 [Hyphomicrobiaceae bacterium]
MTPNSRLTEAECQASIGHNSANPLADLSRKETFILCVWHSDETTAKKIFLLCIALFFNEMAKSASMTFAMIARYCALARRTAMRLAQEVVGKEGHRQWLSVEVNQGHYVAGKGNANIYHGIIPPDVLASLRASMRDGAGCLRITPLNAAIRVKQPKLSARI